MIPVDCGDADDDDTVTTGSFAVDGETVVFAVVDIVDVDDDVAVAVRVKAEDVDCDADLEENFIGLKSLLAGRVVEVTDVVTEDFDGAEMRVLEVMPLGEVILLATEVKLDLNAGEERATAGNIFGEADNDAKNALV